VKRPPGQAPARGPQQSSGRNPVILSDFDGTMTDVDAGELVLERFAFGDWRRYDQDLEGGKITLEECLRGQFAMVRASPGTIADEVAPLVSFRRGVSSLVNYCQEVKIPFFVVSGGLDFLIKKLLKRERILDRVSLYAPRATATPEGISLHFPRTPGPGQVDFKGRLVDSRKGLGERVCYIGDGLSDFGAIRRAEVRFVVKGSKLASLCAREKVAVKEIADFIDVKAAIAASYGASRALRRSDGLISQGKS
jgi:2-hydroxy-3-keto-5-methylthiopentenyl-1-phosphate phosphatase